MHPVRSHDRDHSYAARSIEPLEEKAGAYGNERSPMYLAASHIINNTEVGSNTIMPLVPLGRVRDHLHGWECHIENEAGERVRNGPPLVLGRLVTLEQRAVDSQFASDTNESEQPYPVQEDNHHHIMIDDISVGEYGSHEEQLSSGNSQDFVEKAPTTVTVAQHAAEGGRRPLHVDDFLFDLTDQDKAARWQYLLHQSKTQKRKYGTAHPPVQCGGINLALAPFRYSFVTTPVSERPLETTEPLKKVWIVRRNVNGLTQC